MESDRAPLYRFPDFLIVGPQRTGTTWLHAVLREHPEVFLAEPKELFFFSRLLHRDHPRFESARLDWYLDRFRDPFPLWVYKQSRSLVRYHRPYLPKVRGEATASYAALEPEIIDEVALLRPGVKVLFTLRDPVERAWSHAKKDLARNRGRKASDVSEAEWHAFFRDPYQLRCARYEENLSNWRSRIGDAGVFVSTFDEIEETPERLLGRVTRFLGVSDDPRFVDPELLRSTVNPTAKSEVPDKFRAFLEDLLAAEIADWKRLSATPRN